MVEVKEEKTSKEGETVDVFKGRSEMFDVFKALPDRMTSEQRPVLQTCKTEGWSNLKVEKINSSTK